jgi:uncharacterized cupin superfamily protein
VIIHATEVAVTPGKKDPIVSRKLLIRDTHGGDLSMNWAQLYGEHERIRTYATTRVYYILDGDGWFQLDEDPVDRVKAGDLVLVPRGAAYSWGGYMTYVLINGPAFSVGDDELLPKPEALLEWQEQNLPKKA